MRSDYMDDLSTVPHALSSIDIIDMLLLVRFSVN